MSDHWPSIRATLIALVLLWHGLLASPIPSSVNAKTFDNPIAEAELQRWTQLLGQAGFETTPQQLEVLVIEHASGLAAGKKAALKPLRPIQRVLGIGQAWGLFTYPNTYPHQMVISIRDRPSEPWRTIYAALDPEHDWRKSHFVYRRIRGVYDDNASNTRPSYGNFVDWVATMAFEDFPEANEVRVHMIRRHVKPPGKVPDLETDIRLSRVVRRSQLEAAP